MKSKGADCAEAKSGNVAKARKDHTDAVDDQAAANLDLALKERRRNQALTQQEATAEKAAKKAAVEAAEKAEREAREAAERVARGMEVEPAPAVVAAERKLAKEAAGLANVEGRERNALLALKDAEAVESKAASSSQLRSSMRPQRAAATRRLQDAREQTADAREELAAAQAAKKKSEKRHAAAQKALDAASEKHFAELDDALVKATAARKAREQHLAGVIEAKDPEGWARAKEALDAAVLEEVTTRRRLSQPSAGEKADADTLAAMSKAAWAKQNASDQVYPAQAPDMEQRYSSWLGRLTDEEVEAIQFYKDSSFELNSIMRGLPVTAREFVDMNMARAAPRHIKTALEKAPPPPDDLFVYRKVYPKGSPAFIKNLEETKPGEVKQFDGFNSTSLEPEAYGWWRPDPEPPYRFEIRPLHGAYIENLGEERAADQREFLMRAGMRLRYLGQRKRTMKSPDGEVHTHTYHQWEEVSEAAEAKAKEAAARKGAQAGEAAGAAGARQAAEWDEEASKAAWRSVNQSRGPVETSRFDVEDAYRGWLRGMSEEEEEALRAYESPLFSTINGLARGEAVEASPEDLKKARQAVRLLPDLLSRAPRTEKVRDGVIAYRMVDTIGKAGDAPDSAVNVFGKRLREAKPGEVQRFDGFTSTSLEPRYILSGTHVDGDYAMEIKLKRGAPTFNPDEEVPAYQSRHFLLPPGSYLRYVGTRRDVSFEPLPWGKRMTRTVHQWEEVVPEDGAQLQVMEAAEEAARKSIGMVSAKTARVEAADYLDADRRKAKLAAEAAERKAAEKELARKKAEQAKARAEQEAAAKLAAEQAAKKAAKAAEEKAAQELERAAKKAAEQAAEKTTQPAAASKPPARPVAAPAVEVDWKARKSLRSFWTSRVAADEEKAKATYEKWAEAAGKDREFTAALQEYGEGSGAVNALLRRGIAEGGGREAAKQADALAARIREAPAAPDDLFVYRKVDLDGASDEFRTRMRDLKIGAVEEFRGISSTSLSPSAYEAATTSMFMEIKPLAGAFTEMVVPGAKDFMLRPNVKLRFMGVTKRRIDRSMWPKSQGPAPATDKDLPRVIVHMFEEVPETDGDRKSLSGGALAYAKKTFGREPVEPGTPSPARAAPSPPVADVEAAEELAEAGVRRKAAESDVKKAAGKDAAARLDAAEAAAKSARAEQVARQKVAPPTEREKADAGWLEAEGRRSWAETDTRKLIEPGSEADAGARYAQWTKGLEAEEVDAFSVYSRFTGPMNTMLRGGKVPRSSGTTRPYLAERAERIQEALDKAPLPPKGLVVYRRGDADAASLKRLEAVKPGDVEKFDGFQSATLDPGEMGGGGYRMEIRPLRGGWVDAAGDGGQREFLMGHGTRMRYLGQREKTFLEAGERKTAIFHQWEEVPAVPGVEAAVEKAVDQAQAAVAPAARKVAAWDEKASKAAWRDVNSGNEPVEPNRWDLDETYREWSKTWTKEEEAGLRSYESPLFSTINGLLRGETPAASPEDLERAKDAIRRINSLLERAPEADKVPDGLFAYRVVDTWGPVDAPDELRAFGRRMRNAKPGDVQKFDGYTSTSLAPRVILDFPLIRGDYNMEIRVKRGAPTLQPDEEVGGAGEAMQFLMPAGSYLRYIGKREAEYKPLYGGKREKITLHQWEEVVPENGAELQAMAAAEKAARKKAGVSEGGLAPDYLDENHVKAAVAAGDVLAANACLTATRKRVEMGRKAAKK